MSALVEPFNSSACLSPTRFNFAAADQCRRLASRLVANGFTSLGFVLKNPSTDNRFVAQRTDRLDRNTLSGWLASSLAWPSAANGLAAVGRKQ